MRSDFDDLTGRVFGRWRVIRYTRSERTNKKYQCVCECGAIREVWGNSLKRGVSKSCGCAGRPFGIIPHSPSLVGKTFGVLTVIGDAARKPGKGQYLGRRQQECVCLCGLTIIYSRNHLRQEPMTCGAKCRLPRQPHNHKHGHASGNVSSTYITWANLFARCYNPKSARFKYYGGANPSVKVCDRWNPAKGGSFENFLSDMGPRPDGTTLGRFLDLGNYEPGNCAWQTRLEQGAERRKKRLLKSTQAEVAA